jgi:hypothetical protein
MRRVTLVSLLGILATAVVCPQTAAVNRITVESIVLPDNPGRAEVGIYLENDQPIAGVFLTLVLRSEHCGDSVVSAEMSLSGRVSELLVIQRTLRHSPGVSGECGEDGFSGDYYDDGGPNPVAALPEGFLFIAIGSANAGGVLEPGTDIPGNPSIVVALTFPDGERGTYALDSSCIAPPSNYAYTDVDGSEIRPEFIGGVITVGSCCGRCQPFNTTGNVDFDTGNFKEISDILMLARYSLLGGTTPVCLAEANIDGDSQCFTDISDVLRLARFSLQGGQEPAPCLPQCE